MKYQLIFTAAALVAVTISSIPATGQVRPQRFTDNRSISNGALNRANFGRFLVNAGFEITRGVDDSHYTFLVNVGADRIRFSAWLLDETSPTRITITAPLHDLSDAYPMPASIAARLLAENDQHAPVFFALSKCGAGAACSYVLRAQSFLENKYADPEMFRVGVSKIAAAINNTRDLWDSANWPRPTR